MNIGRKIYYDKITGEVIQDTGQRSGDVIETTIEQDYSVYKSLIERASETVGLIQLEFDQFIQDFEQCNGYKVNIETGKLEFSYPDPNQPQSEPVYQKPLSEQVSELKEENALLKAQMRAQSDRSYFIEDVIAEMAAQVYE